MFRDAYQRGLLTIFFSCGSKPLKLWDTYTQDGYITKFLDEDIRSTVLEIGGTNVSTTYMICPKGKQVLGITMPFLVMIVKNIKKYFSFEITILDDTGTRRRFRVSNFQSTTQILPLCTVMPIALSDGWNQIQFNMSDFCRRAYQKQFVEVQKCKINANIRVRRIYFADRIFSEDQLPSEYKLFIPLKKRPAKDKATTDAEVVAPENVPIKIASRAQKEKKSPKVLEKLANLITIETAPVVAAAEGASVQIIATEEPVATGEEPVAAGEETVAAGEEMVAAGEEMIAAGEEMVAAGEEMVAVGEETVAAGEEMVAAGEETVAAIEGGFDQDDAMTTEPEATFEEPVAEASFAIGETPVTEEAAAESTEPVTEKSVETTEPVKEKSVESTEPEKEKSVETIELVKEKSLETTEPVKERSIETTVPVKEKSVETTEPVKEKSVETTELIKEKSVESATQYDPVPVEDKTTDAAEVEERTQSAGRLEPIEENE